MDNENKIRLTRNLWVITFVVWLMYSTINSFGAHLYWLGIGENFRYINVFIWYFTAGILWWLATPLFIWVLNTFPWDTTKWLKIVSANILIGIIIAPIHRYFSLLLSYLAQKSLALFEVAPLSFTEYIRDKFIQLTVEGLLSYFAIIFIFYSYAIFINNRKIRYENTELENTLINAQLQVLRSQLNPHFLFNSLHTITGLILNKDEKVAIKTLTGLSEILRYSIGSSNSQLVPLHEELEVLGRYLQIHEVRMGARFTVEMDCEDGLKDVLIPSFLLQPIVENAMVHGIMKISGEGRVLISIRRAGTNIRIEVKDNGPGIESHYTKGIGLLNTMERLNLLYHGNHTFDINNTNPGTAVTIVLPIQS